MRLEIQYQRTGRFSVSVNVTIREESRGAANTRKPLHLDDVEEAVVVNRTGEENAAM